MNIKHIFFDLDRTLWDFESNSLQTLTELFNQFNLSYLGLNSAENFIRKYKIHNERLWDLYREDKITKEELRGKRFYLTLKEYGIEDERLSEKIGLEYVRKSPLKKKLFPYTLDVLNYLNKKYEMHIITNGFEEVQHVKLSQSGLSSFFKHIITSEKVGVKKPNIKIFEYAFNKAKAQKDESILIGDDLIADIFGAKNAGIQQIYFNPNKIIHDENIEFEINCLSQLKELL